MQIKLIVQNRKDGIPSLIRANSSCDRCVLSDCWILILQYQEILCLSCSRKYCSSQSDMDQDFWWIQECLCLLNRCWLYQSWKCILVFDIWVFKRDLWVFLWVNQSYPEQYLEMNLSFSQAFVPWRTSQILVYVELTRKSYRPQKWNVCMTKVKQNM